jgi:hypothetical protein
LLTVAFSALIEPCGERRSELIGFNAKAGFETAFACGKRIVKIGGICEIAHAETIQPVERTRLAFISDDEIDGKFLRVHEKEYNVTPQRNGGLVRPVKVSIGRFAKLRATLHRRFLANSGARAIQFYVENLKRCL